MQMAIILFCSSTKERTKKHHKPENNEKGKRVSGVEYLQCCVFDWALFDYIMMMIVGIEYEPVFLKALSLVSIRLCHLSSLLFQLVQ